MTLPWLRFILILGVFANAPATISAFSLPLLTANPELTLTIQNHACPVTYEGANYADDCRAPVANLEFMITAPETQIQTATTDPTGVVTFSGLPSGTYEVTGGPPGAYVQNAIACHPTSGEAVPHPFLPRDNRAIGVTLDDTDVTCDWFSIPEDLRGDA